MSQKLYAYRSRGAPVDDDRRLLRWFPKDGAPASIVGDDGEPWDLVLSRPRDTTTAFKCIKEGFRSISLPRWWPFAKRHDAGGACIFESETEAIDAVKRARDAGEPVSWDR